MEEMQQPKSQKGAACSFYIKQQDMLRLISMYDFILRFAQF